MDLTQFEALSSLTHLLVFLAAGLAPGLVIGLLFVRSRRRDEDWRSGHG